MRQYEAPLWGRLGAVDSARLATTRSRRSRRELYRRWLEDALIVQSLYQPDARTAPEVGIEPELHQEIFDWLHAVSPRIPLGVPTRQLIPIGEDTLELILLDLRGQAPTRANSALQLAGQDLANSTEAIGVAVIHGVQGQTDMLQMSIRRWIQDYGRGKSLRAAPSSNGTILALDPRRLTDIATSEAPGIPLADEVTVLQELLVLAGGRLDSVKLPYGVDPGFARADDGETRPKRKRRRRGRGGKGRLNG